MDFNFLIICIKVAIKYIPTTLYLGIVSFVIGLLIGIPIALARFFKVRFWGNFFKWSISVTNSIPLLLTLSVFFLIISDNLHGWGLIFNQNWQFKYFDRKWIAITALSVFSVNYVAEAVRASLISVPALQWEASASIGFDIRQTFIRIIFPQAFKISIPVFGNILTNIIKGSSLVSTVSVIDLLNAVLIKAQSNYDYLEAYLAAALVYWGLCTAVKWGFKLFYVISDWRRVLYARG